MRYERENTVRVSEKTKENAVRYLEKGNTLSEVSKMINVGSKTLKNWWYERHPKLDPPYRYSAAPMLKMLRIDERKVQVRVFECPHCGGVVYHVPIDLQVPRHCYWCGNAVH